jgi:MraZ protein
LDKKGRISVPASFRSALAGLGEHEMVFFPSYTQPCIECWPARVFDDATSGHDDLDLFSKDADDIAGAVFAQSAQMRPDGEGRVSLDERHIEAAGLTEAILFIGVRRRFQIWDAERGEAFLRESIANAREKGLTLAARTRPGAQP